MYWSDSLVWWARYVRNRRHLISIHRKVVKMRYHCKLSCLAHRWNSCRQTNSKGSRNILCKDVRHLVFSRLDKVSKSAPLDRCTRYDDDDVERISALIWALFEDVSSAPLCTVVSERIEFWQVMWLHVMPISFDSSLVVLTTWELICKVEWNPCALLSCPIREFPFEP